MALLYDFRCPEGHVTESFVSSGTTEARCKDCGKPAKRMISPIRSVLDPFTGHFPDATTKWAKYHEEQAKKTP